MKKTLLALALTAAVTPSFDASAEAVSKVWEYITPDLNADWDSGAPNWSSTDAIKTKSCARFGTAADGKVYTFNMTTMSIAEITADGWKDIYKLPAPANKADYYGTAIQVDQAGNFLIGHYFTKAPESSLVWSIYSPSTDKINTFELDDPGVEDLVGNTAIGRIDCVGRVLGDLTDKAVFFIAPQYDATPHKIANNVRVVNISNEGGDLLVEDNFYPVYNSSIVSVMQQAVAQPKTATYAEYAALDHESDGFLLYANTGAGATNCGTYSNGTFDWSFYNSPIREVVNNAASGFDSFVIGGKRYYVVNYAVAPTKKNMRGMNIGVINEEGKIVGVWESSLYNSEYGYSTIVAEPLDNGTANIYIYNSTSNDPGTGTGACVGAAMLNFDPAKIEITEDPVGSTADNPIEVATADDLVNLRSKLVTGNNHIALTSDIDMEDVDFEVIVPEGAKYNIYLDGRYHVIRNLKITKDNGSLLGSLTGSVKNLGIEDVDINVKWYCVGAIAGMASNASIDNCYSTGSITGAAAGGLVGANLGNLTVTNCYSRAKINDTTAGNTGGLIGRSDAPLTIINSFASNEVTSMGNASGIVSVRNSKSVSLNSVVVWNTFINGTVAADAVCVAGDATLTTDNVYVWDGTAVNGSTLKTGKSDEFLRELVQGWDAFSDTELVEYVPVLKWQVEETGGISDIIADEPCESAPAVYYNLQGLKVNNPANGGIYIVRRGNKVTKELLK